MRDQGVEAGWILDLPAEDDASGMKNLAEIERAVEQVRTQGGRCKEIAHKLLSFAGKTDPTLKAFDLNELIEEMIALADQKARYASVRIEAELDPADLPPIAASGTGAHEAKTFFGLTLDIRTDVIIALVDGEMVEQVLLAIKEAGQFSEPGAGTAFVVAVEQTVGFESQVSKPQR